MSALSNNQKAYLAQLAERAFNLAAARLRGEGAEMRLAGITVHNAPNRETALEVLLLDGKKAARDAWRREQVSLACAKAGLTACSQLDYKTVEGHFLDLIGRPAAALNAHYRGTSEPKRQAYHNVVNACVENEYALGYAAALCLRIHKVTLDNAGEEVLRKVMFTVINHGKKKRDKEERKKQQKEMAV